jgi:hypothetical protein
VWPESTESKGPHDARSSSALDPGLVPAAAAAPVPAPRVTKRSPRLLRHLGDCSWCPYPDRLIQYASIDLVRRYGNTDTCSRNWEGEDDGWGEGAEAGQEAEAELSWAGMAGSPATDPAWHVGGGRRLVPCSAAAAWHRLLALGSFLPVGQSHRWTRLAACWRPAKLWYGGTLPF